MINTATNTVAKTIQVGSSPSAVAVSPNGTRVYVANTGSNTVSVIDTTKNYQVVGTVAVGSAPTAVAVSPTGAQVYVANRTSNTISVIDTRRNTLATSITVGSQPSSVAVSPDGKRPLCDQHRKHRAVRRTDPYAPPTPLPIAGTPNASGAQAPPPVRLLARARLALEPRRRTGLRGQRQLTQPRP